MKTAMEADYHSADRVLLAELVLHGKFYEIPERLYYHRLHAHISTRDGMTMRELTAWFNPAQAGKRKVPAVPAARRVFQVCPSRTADALATCLLRRADHTVLRVNRQVQRLFRRIRSRLRPVRAAHGAALIAERK